ncbi:hypothetical protein JOH51_001430 [Rhizobium leguminosarum]|nr:hypothetical protein [Rhizobium leguminosarum]
MPVIVARADWGNGKTDTCRNWTYVRDDWPLTGQLPPYYLRSQ